LGKGLFVRQSKGYMSWV